MRWSSVLKPAQFPRHFMLSHIPVAVPDSFQPTLRILSPESGAMRFGPFQIFEPQLSTVARLGNRNPCSSPSTPAGEADCPETRIRFGRPISSPMRSPRRVSFYFAFQGNTPRGENVVPASASQ